MNGMKKIIFLLILASGEGSLTAKRLTFAVFGDNRGDNPPEQPPVFSQMLKEMNLFMPAFGFNTGDMILGYTSDSALIEREWDVYDSVTSVFKSHIFHVPGNHDIWDSVSYRIYRRRFGPTYFAFDTLGSLFIVLNSDEPGYRETISPPQLKWFKKLLARSRGKYDHIFVFIHRPLFWETATAKWWMDEIHPMLVKAGVDAVFAGHWHVYEADTVDGIWYAVSGGAGAHIGRYPEAGYFYHYLIVTVDGDSFSWAVIKPGNVHPPDVVTYQQAHDHWFARSFMVSNPWVFSDRDSGRFCIKVRNLLQGEREFHFRWDENGWKIQPETVSVSLPSDSQTTLCFDYIRGRRMPVLTYSLNFYDTMTTTIYKNMDFAWEKVVFRQPAMSTISVNADWCRNIHGHNDFSGKIGIQWENNGLHFVADIMDDSNYVLRDSMKRTLGDAMVIAFDTDDPFDRYDSSGIYTSFIFVPDPNSPLVERRYAIPLDGLWPVDSVRFSVTRTDTSTTYDIFLPWQTFSTTRVDAIFTRILLFENDGKRRKCVIKLNRGYGMLRFAPGKY